MVHTPGHPVKGPEGRNRLDVGDQLLDEDGRVHNIIGTTDKLLMLDTSRMPKHRGPIEGDYSKSIWDSTVPDEAARGMPVGSEEDLERLRRNTQGPTKYSSAGFDYDPAINGGNVQEQRAKDNDLNTDQEQAESVWTQAEASLRALVADIRSTNPEIPEPMAQRIASRVHQAYLAKEAMGTPFYQKGDAVWHPHSGNAGRVVRVINHPSLDVPHYDVAWGPEGWDEADPLWRPSRDTAVDLRDRGQMIPEHDLRPSPSMEAHQPGQRERHGPYWRQTATQSLEEGGQVLPFRRSTLQTQADAWSSDPRAFADWIHPQSDGPLTSRIGPLQPRQPKEPHLHGQGEPLEPKPPKPVEHDDALGNPGSEPENSWGAMPDAEPVGSQGWDPPEFLFSEHQHTPEHNPENPAQPFTTKTPRGPQMWRKVRERGGQAIEKALDMAKSIGDAEKGQHPGSPSAPGGDWGSR